MVGYSPRLTVRSVPPGRVMRMVLARLSRSSAWITASLRPGGAISSSSSSGPSITISTRRAGVARLLQPAGEQRNVQADQHVGGLDGVERALAAADRLDADLGPGRHGVDAHLVGVGAEILRGGEGRGHVVAARAEIAEQHDGLALLHVAELKFLAKQHRELGVIDGFMHGDHSGMCKHRVQQKPAPVNPLAPNQSVYRGAVSAVRNA